MQLNKIIDEKKDFQSVRLGGFQNFRGYKNSLYLINETTSNVSFDFS